MTSRRKFIQGAAIAPAAVLATPALAQNTIKWRMQTYAGSALAAEVIVPAIEMFNKIAGDRMQIEVLCRPIGPNGRIVPSHATRYNRCGPI